MNTIVQLELSPLQLEILSGFFLGQCYDLNRDNRKTAIKNFGVLYSIIDDENLKEQLHEIQEHFENTTEEKKKAIAIEMAEAIKKFFS